MATSSQAGDLLFKLAGGDVTLVETKVAEVARTTKGVTANYLEVGKRIVEERIRRNAFPAEIIPQLNDLFVTVGGLDRDLIKPFLERNRKGDSFECVPPGIYLFREGLSQNEEGERGIADGCYGFLWKLGISG